MWKEKAKERWEKKTKEARVKNGRSRQRKM